MFSTLLDCGEPLQKYINKMATANKAVEFRELAAQYTTNIIASVAFGIEVNAIDNPETEFRKYGRKVNFYIFINIVCLLSKRMHLLGFRNEFQKWLESFFNFNLSEITKNVETEICRRRC